MSEAAKKVIWTKKFIAELGVVLEIEVPVPLYYNNNGAVVQAKESMSYQKFKHIL